MSSDARMALEAPALLHRLARAHGVQPEYVGLTRGPRRRTDGLRREEVASLCHMSTDYYSRLERATGRPSRVARLLDAVSGRA